jgi:iron complex outermembrane recepter protein
MKAKQSRKPHSRCLALIAGSLLAIDAVHAQTDGTDFLQDQNFPVVISPTRLKQSLPDVPASVTVITAEMMQKLGINSIVDALRLVPGMEITQAAGNDYRVNYHGTNIFNPRRMNVLIDGISAYQPAYARVMWKQLPVALEDVDRIEVTRGPDSAAYGPNSMMAIVNIITKHPKDVERGMASVTAGSLGTIVANARVGANLGETSIRLTVETEQDKGYDYQSVVGQDHDSTKMRRLNVRSVSKLGDQSNLDLQAAYVEGSNQVPFVVAGQTSFPDQHVRDYYLQAAWTRQLSPDHEFQARINYADTTFLQSWNSCVPTAALLPQVYDLWRANPSYVRALLTGHMPSGGTANDNALAATAIHAIASLGARATQPTCGVVNQNLRESRTDVEVQDTYVFSEKLRIVGGFGARAQRGISDTFFAGSSSNTVYHVFGNAEYKPSKMWTLNAGGYFENNSLSGSSFSPRVAANMHLSDNQTLRFVVSQGTRTPDLFEETAKWSYTVANLNPPLNGTTTTPFYQSAFSKGGLNEERILSKEIGYLLNMPSAGVVLDVKFFDDRLSDLISEKLQVSNFMPTNGNSVRLRGAEAQVNLELSPSWSGHLTYAYLDNFDATTLYERAQYSRNSGSLSVTHKLDAGWWYSLAYYGASGNGLGQSAYGRTDLTVGKSFNVGGSRLTASLVVSHLDNQTASYFRDFGSVATAQYNSKFQMFGQLKASF